VIAEQSTAEIIAELVAQARDALATRSDPAGAFL
jgi:hypothetical protein